MIQAQAHAHRLIGAAEPLLWPAQRAVAEVAIIYPRSASLWDLSNQSLTGAYRSPILDCSNVDMLGGTVDYYAEVFGIYSLLAVGLNIPVRIHLSTRPQECT